MIKIPTPLPTYVKQFVEKSQSKIFPFIISGELNREYISGNQFQKIDAATKTIVQKIPPQGVYLERKIINRMLPIYLTRNGILSDNKPIPGFKSNPGDPEYDNQAVDGNRFFTDFFKAINYDNIYKKLIAESDVFPLVWIKTGINWNAGDLIGTQEVKVTNQYGEVETKRVHLNEGRPFIDIVPISEGFPDSLSVSDMSQINEFVHRRPFTLEYIQKKYGFIAEAESINTNYIPKMEFGNSPGDFENHTYVYEYYRKSDAIFPDGRYAIIINDSVLYDGKLPFENGSNNKRLIPIDCVALQRVTGFLPGITIYSQLIDQQDSYNAVHNRLLEYINKVGIGQKFAWKGSLVNDRELINKPGTITMLTRFGKKPENDTIDPIGFEFVTYLKTIEENMLITAGLSAMTAYGQTTSNVRSDGVADKIAESDSNKLGNALKNLSEGITNIMSKIINVEKQRQKYLIEEFGLDMIDKNVLKYDLKELDASQVEIVNREFLMQSDQIIEKKLMQATSMGLYSSEFGMSYRAKLHALDMIKANYLRETLNPIESANWSQIQTEHKKLFLKKEIEVKPYQDHPMHMEEHHILLMSQKMEALKTTNKDLYNYIVAQLEEHISKHQKLYRPPQQQRVPEGAKAYV